MKGLQSIGIFHIVRERDKHYLARISDRPTAKCHKQVGLCVTRGTCRINNGFARCMRRHACIDISEPVSQSAPHFVNFICLVGKCFTGNQENTHRTKCFNLFCQRLCRRFSKDNFFQRRTLDLACSSHDTHMSLPGSGKSETFERRWEGPEHFQGEVLPPLVQVKAERGPGFRQSASRKCGK